MSNNNNTNKGTVNGANNNKTNNNMEDMNMRTNNNVEVEVMEEVAATVEMDETMGEKASRYVNGAREKIEFAGQMIMDGAVKGSEELKRMANMSDDDLEDYIKVSGMDLMNKIKEGLKDKIGSLKRLKEAGFGKDGSADRQIKQYEASLQTIKDVLDDDEIHGWAKVKAVVKEIVRWVLKLLVTVAKIFLKLALTAAVGAIKITAIGVSTAIKVGKVAKKEIVDPAWKKGKEIVGDVKELKKESQKKQDIDYDASAYAPE